MNKPVLVLDFGSQYAHLITRRLRELNVYAQIVRYDIAADRVNELDPAALVLSGGPASVYEQGAPRCDPGLFGLGLPILGICYGMQLVCDHFGGTVQPDGVREFGSTECHFGFYRLFNHVPILSNVLMSHGDRVTDCGDRLQATAWVGSTELTAAIRHRDLPIYGLQFHPEVDHTEAGQTILSNFLNIAKAPRTWTTQLFLQQEINRLQERIKPCEHVICGLSGGVDSAVCAAILGKLEGVHTHAILVDNGLLRAGERDQIECVFGCFSYGNVELTVVDARDQFLSALAGITDPQEKRMIVGREFINVFAQEAKKFSGARYLAQGTIYPDVIESGGTPDSPAAVIKAHHNVGGLPQQLGFELVEPLRELYKDEVRRLGLKLGLPASLVNRHPFPGPGLAVRCLGSVTPERLAILRQADGIFLEELQASGWMQQTSQAFAVLLPVQSVGVMGDGRTYENTIALRAVTTNDFMTASWSRIEYEVLAKVSSRIVNSVKGVNRVVYDITDKPPATIEWE